MELKIAQEFKVVFLIPLKWNRRKNEISTTSSSKLELKCIALWRSSVHFGNRRIPKKCKILHSIGCSHINFNCLYLCLSQLYILKCTTHWNWKYTAINHMVQGITNRCSEVSTNKSPGKLNIDGSSVKTGTQIFRSRTTLHSLRHSRDNVCGTINDIFLTWRNRVKRMRHFKIPVKSLSNCNTAWWLVREILKAIQFSLLPVNPFV